jgi:hypothetical protein
VTGQDSNIGRPQHSFNAYLQDLRANNRVKRRELDPDRYDLAARMSKQLGDSSISDFENYFIASGNSQVLRKRVNFIRFADFALDQNSMRVYSEDELRSKDLAGCMPSWSYLDVRFRDVAYEFSALQDAAFSDYKIEDTVSNYGPNEIDEKRASRLRHRKQQQAARVQAARDFPSLLVPCNDDGLPVAKEVATTEYLIWPQGSRHLLRIYEDQEWPWFAIQFRLVLLARNFFWHFITEEEIQKNRQHTLRSVRCTTNEALPVTGEGGEFSHTVCVDFGKAASGKSTVVTFLSGVNGDMCKHVNPGGCNPEFFGGQITGGPVMNIIIDELSKHAKFPVHDFLQMCSGAKGSGNIKHEQKLRPYQWVYAITMICNDGEFPTELTTNQARLKRRIWPFHYTRSLAETTDETLVHKITQVAGHVHLEVLMQRHLYRLDCKRLRISNYNQWVKARDVTGFMRQCQISFFMGITTADGCGNTPIRLLQENGYELLAAGYVPVAPFQSLLLVGNYKNDLKGYIRQRHDDVVDEISENEGEVELDTVLTRLEDEGIKIKLASRDPRHEWIKDNNLFDYTSVTVQSLNDLKKTKERPVDEAWKDAANILLGGSSVKVVTESRPWPPGQQAVELKTSYIVGCAPKNWRHLYVGGSAEKQLRVVVFPKLEPSWLLECRLTHDVYGWVQEWHRSQDMFSKDDFAQFGLKTRNMTTRVSAWTDPFKGIERLFVCIE